MIDSQGEPVSAREITFAVEAARLLDAVSLRADKGQLVGLIGPNGSGKSTFLHTIAGLLRLQSGTVSLSGRDLGDMSAKEVASGLALVPQIAPYTHGFTQHGAGADGQVPAPGQVSGGRAGGRQHRAACHAADGDRALRGTHARHDVRRRAASASSFPGRWRSSRRCCCWTSPHRTSTCCNQLKVFELVRRLVDDGLTAIAAIHDLNLAARYCDRMVLLSEGARPGRGDAGGRTGPEHDARGLRRRCVGVPGPGHGGAGRQRHRPCRRAGERPHTTCVAGRHTMASPSAAASNHRPLPCR